MRLDDDITGLREFASDGSSDRDARLVVGDNIASQRALGGEGEATEKATTASEAIVYYRMILSL